MQQLKGHTLTQFILDVLGRGIVLGSYDARTFPTEAELAKQYGVSRSVIREAVKMLTSKGLLSSRPRKGTAITARASWNLLDTEVLRWLLEQKPSVVLLRQLNEVRAAIEPEAAALAASRLDHEEYEIVASIRKNIELSEGHCREAHDAIVLFHITILKACKNQFFVQFEYLIEAALRCSFQIDGSVVLSSRSVAAYSAIQRAMLARQPAKAREVMRKIISQTMSRQRVRDRGKIQNNRQCDDLRSSLR